VHKTRIRKTKKKDYCDVATLEAKRENRKGESRGLIKIEEGRR